MVSSPGQHSMELLLGCGSTREKKVGVIGRSQWDNLVTLDHNPAHKGENHEFLLRQKGGSKERL